MTRGSLTLSGRKTSTVAATTRLRTHTLTYLNAAAAVGGAQKAMFSVWGTGGIEGNGGIGGTYTLNASRWLPDVDFTSSPVWIEREASPRTWGRGCLVTPKHIIGADHFGYGVGQEIVFHGASGALYSRTIDDLDRTIGYDIQTAILDEPLPSDVTPAKLLPANASTWIALQDLYDKFPLVSIDQDLQLIARRWMGYGAGGYHASVYAHNVSPLSTFAEEMVDGDSGSATYAIINGEAVLVMEYYGIDSGPAYHVSRTAIDASIATLFSGYSITSVDLSGFLT